ncbi:hypothetical protein MHY87_01065 [Microvirga sp. ACRRW]|uniref:hypothetical protein n=1 Tax=Microvirga sp. ACRRW TaxID=2918205 RepID=UPI001EF6C711|nr:hypothetical protein [Microvirga sp. ACRRW]MCG7391498.1 hypothetical protein [Microvirga sp. ACRRW]
MNAKDLAALYGRVALVMLVFAFVAGIVAGPLVYKAGVQQSANAVQDQPTQELIRGRMTAFSGRQG